MRWLQGALPRKICNGASATTIITSTITIPIIARATISALRARWIDLVASRFEVSHRVARTTLSAPWVRVLSLWRGAAFS